MSIWFQTMLAIWPFVSGIVIGLTVWSVYRSYCRRRRVKQMMDRLYDIQPGEYRGRDG